MAPEERGDERSAAVAAREKVGPRARVEQQPRQLSVVAVAGLVELRPAVVVAAVHVGAAFQEQSSDVKVACHAEEVVAVRAALAHKLRVLVEQYTQPLEIAVHDRGPAGVALVARQHELRARKTRRQAAQARNRRRVPCTRGAGEFLRLLAKLFEVHHDLLPHGPMSAASGGKKITWCYRVVPDEVGSALSADRMRPRSA